MKQSDKIHISLAIDSDTNTSFDLDPNEDLDSILRNIVKKYNLSQKVEKNLKKYVENFIVEEMKKEKEKKKEQYKKGQECVKRLFDQSVANQQKKKEILQKLKEDQFKEFLNSCSFKPQIKYHKALERNYDKIENKLLEDGKKKLEKNARKRIAKEMELRNHLKSIRSKERYDTHHSQNSSTVYDEKKFLLTEGAAGHQSNPKNNQNTNNNILGMTFQPVNFNTAPNYQILIFDENNKSLNKGLENSLLKAKPVNALSSNSLNITNVNNNRVVRSSSKNMVSVLNRNLDNSITKKEAPLLKNQESMIGKIEPNTFKALDNSITRKDAPNFRHLESSITRKEAPNFKHLDSSITRKEAQAFKNPLDNSISRKEAAANKMSFLNTNFNANPLQMSSQSNKRYTEQYLSKKDKNNTETIHNLSLHHSNVSQKKNDSSVSNSQQNNNNQEMKIANVIKGNRNTTTNEIIEKYNSAKKINKSISFGIETNRSREKLRTMISKEKQIYTKKIISNKKNVIKPSTAMEKKIDYRFKVEKKKFNSNTIYESSKQREQAKLDHYKHIKSLEYSFRPVLTEASREYISKSLNKHEKRDDFFNRLTNSKRVKNLSLNLEKRNKSMQSITTPTSFKTGIKRSYSNKSNNTYTNKFATTTEETDLKSYKNTAGTAERDESSRIREKKKKKELIENIKHQQYKEKKMLTNCTEKILDNINKFKLNNLKEIFEIIYNNCSNINDIQNIENYGINAKIRDKLILPTCHIMKERSLEFNFQNFFLISNEIINITIDA